MKTETLAQKLKDGGLRLATIESCTGGGIAACCTDLPGSSAWFNGSVVTYSNEMKARLGVDPLLIEQYGAVSEEVVQQMAECGLTYCEADWAVAVTGIAGPTGGTEQKPIGTVWFAWSNGESTVVEQKHFDGDRVSVRAQTVSYAIDRLTDLIS